MNGLRGSSTAGGYQPPTAQHIARELEKPRQDQPTTEITITPSSRELSGSAFMPAYTLEVALARREAIVQFTRRIMVENQDFGTIPGTNKPSLLKPGAEKLCNFFGLEPEFTPLVEEADWTGETHREETFYYVRYRCRLLRDGRVVGVGEGSCNSWESKYRYRWVPAEQVPEDLTLSKLQTRGGRVSEFEFAIEKAETGGKYGKPLAYWQQFRDAIEQGEAATVTKKTKAGKEFQAWEIDITTYRIANPDVADVVNTIQKMAQKRALVAATLIATSASEFFTQDTEDTPEEQPPNPSWSGIDVGNNKPGTKEAQQHVAARRLEELRAQQQPPQPAVQHPELKPKPAASEFDPSNTRPWKTADERHAVFSRLRERVGETRYYAELDAHNVPDPAACRTWNDSLKLYRDLAAIAQAEQEAA